MKRKNDQFGYDFIEISDSKLNMNKDQVKLISQSSIKY